MMSDRVALEQVEQLALQLPPRGQLKLVAHIGGWLSVTPLATPTEESGVERVYLKRLAQVDAWITRCDKVAELWEGEFDSAADLRRIRDEG